MLKAYKKPFLPLIRYFGKRKAKKHFDQDPIFIGGCGRSGTTLLLSILSAHPQVFACPKELGLFNKVLYDAQGRPAPHRIDRLYRAILTRPMPPQARRFVEKSPSNVKQIAAIDGYFQGRFRFVHIIRDGRDVVLSIHPTDPKRYWVEPERWVNDVKAGLAFRDHPRVLTLFYEDLILNYEACIASICEHCELPLTEEMRNWFAHTTVKKNRAYHEGVSQIHSQSIGKWKKPEFARRVAELLAYPGAQDLLEELGYRP